MKKEVFQFKQFTINQDKCAMKIGTDGVLLGAWTSLKNNPKTILDIGAGTGIIALQLAQRSKAEIIDAIEIEDNAYEQTVENFENSPWSDRLFCYHTSLEEFVNEIESTYELIVSNPPFYNDDFQSSNIARNTARFTTALTFEKLISSVTKLVSKEGLFSTIIPFKEEQKFISIAKKNKLYTRAICRVKGSYLTEIKRSMLEFSFHKSETKISELVIEKQRHNYTDEYINLVKDFYLKM